MKYTSPVVAASIFAILAYAILVKKSPEHKSERRMEVGTISEAPAPIAPEYLGSDKVESRTLKKVAVKSKPRNLSFNKRKIAAENSGAELANVTGMTPALSDYNLTPADADKSLKPKDQKNMINPADGRWINELSGQRAKLKMGQQRTDLSCDDDYRQCERPEGSRDVLLTGMVVKSERLISNPARSMDGKLVRGHYIKKTPAVYVK